ncbi:hypothetical protein ACHAXR_006612 [Thalassiosira sp. AJA248-18]
MFATNANNPMIMHFRIISNVRKLFIGPLVPTRVTLETAEGLTTKTKFVGKMCLVLTDDANNNHTYEVPGCVFDPDSPINILGVPFLGKFFGDQSDNEYEMDDGTTVCSGSIKSHFIWDHGKNERHFRHGSTFSLEPNQHIGDPANLDAMNGPEGDSVDENPIHQWYCPETCDSVTPLKVSPSSDSSPDSDPDSNPG